MAERTDASTTTPQPGPDFIRQIVADDQRTGKHGGRVVTRFPPEPNGYLHIGHAKAIGIDYGIARENDGVFHLRFDDTNPAKEEVEYVDSIMRDVRWLGADWGDKLFYASDYFEQLYQWAEQLIRDGLAYVDESTADQIREMRGTLTEPGRNSPYRDRPAAESVDLFRRMRAGDFPDGKLVLRAKIDMASPNLNMRDPVLYRIRHAEHHRTGDTWCIYPMYDYAHPLSDAIEKITHSICTLEFEDHRPLYDWLIQHVNTGANPQQIEFARGNLSYTVMSKRKLLTLVQQGHVAGWDDPRMPTLSAFRRRGVPAETIRAFWERMGVAKRNSTIDVAMLEHAIRSDLNRTAPRVMAVTRPLKLVIENFPADRVEELEAVNNPEDPAMGTRTVPFSRELYIEQDDFREVPPSKYFRLSPGTEVRLRWAYLVRCTSVVKDASGAVVEVRCTYDPASRGGNPADGRKVKSTIHWVSAAHALPAELRLYDRLFDVEDPSGDDWLAHLNPHSLESVRDAKLEPSLASALPGSRWQFERIGYFCVDDDSKPGALVFNRTVTLRDTWAKIEKRGGN
jgi:glutaminyl-tRNA synthetase